MLAGRDGLSNFPPVFSQLHLNDFAFRVKVAVHVCFGCFFSNFLEHIKVACCLLSGIILVNIYEYFPIISHQLVDRQYIQLHSSAAGETSDLSDLGGWELAAAYPAFGYPYSS